MTDAQREKLLNVLAHVRKRPGMYFTDQVPAVANFMAGFMLACQLLDAVPGDDAHYQEIILERGWEVTSMGIWSQMQERGYSHDAIVDEMLAIYEMFVAKSAAQTSEPQHK